MNSPGLFFNGFADDFDTFYDNRRSRFMQWVDQRFRSDMFVRFTMTFDYLGELDGRRVLDIGCGSGRYIVEALKRGALHVTGIDPAPRMLNLASERITQLGMDKKVEFMEGYFPETAPAGEFDFAIVMGVMDYVEDAPKFVRNLRTVIRRGAIVSLPSTHWFRTPFRGFRYYLRNCRVHFYTPTRIAKLMRDGGITDYKIMKIPGAGMDYVVCIQG